MGPEHLPSAAKMANSWFLMKKIGNSLNIQREGLIKCIMTGPYNGIQDSL